MSTKHKTIKAFLVVLGLLVLGIGPLITFGMYSMDIEDTYGDNQDFFSTALEPFKTSSLLGHSNVHASTSQRDEELARTMGAKGYLVKPNTYSDFFQMLKSCPL